MLSIQIDTKSFEQFNNIKLSLFASHMKSSFPLCKFQMLYGYQRLQSRSMCRGHFIRLSDIPWSTFLVVVANSICCQDDPTSAFFTLQRHKAKRGSVFLFPQRHLHTFYPPQRYQQQPSSQLSVCTFYFRFYSWPNYLMLLLPFLLKWHYHKKAHLLSH